MNDKKITRKWFQHSQILVEHLNLEIRQVSAWITTSENLIILISKDGVKWSIPGGHPEKNESIDQSLNREILEESGLEISELPRKLLGYYLISEIEDNKEDNYLQLRFQVNLLEDLKENLAPSPTDEVKFVKKVNIKDIPQFVKWAKDSDDYNLLLKNSDENK